MKPPYPQPPKGRQQRPPWPRKVAPAKAGDEDWDYPPEFKELISLLAKQAAIDYLKQEQGQQRQDPGE